MTKIAVGVRVYEEFNKDWATIKEVKGNRFLVDWDDGTEGTIWWDEDGFAFGQPDDPRQPTGPVVTETVTKTRIVPGVYDGVEVGETIVIPDCENPDREVHPSLEVSLVGVYHADQLDAAAAVLSALAKGLRDA